MRQMNIAARSIKMGGVSAAAEGQFPDDPFDDLSVDPHIGSRRSYTQLGYQQDFMSRVLKGSQDAAFEDCDQSAVDQFMMDS